MISLLLAFAITLFIEVLLAYFLGYKNKKEILTIIAINLLTNPILNLLVFINYISININFNFFVLFLEVIVVFVEYNLLKNILSNIFPKRNFLLDAIILNTATYLAGIIYIFSK